jgi:hypothetical protein
MDRVVWRVPVATNTILRMLLYLRVPIPLARGITGSELTELKLNSAIYMARRAIKLPAPIIATNTNLQTIERRSIWGLLEKTGTLHEIRFRWRCSFAIRNETHWIT